MGFNFHLSFFSFNGGKFKENGERGKHTAVRDGKNTDFRFIKSHTKLRELEEARYKP